MCTLVTMRYLWFLLYFGISYSYAMPEKSKFEKLKGVRYEVFTKDNRSADIRKTTVFIIHGFYSESLDLPLNLKDDLFKYVPDVDRVIVVSWEDYSTYSKTYSIVPPPFTYFIIAKAHVPRLAQDINEKLIYIRHKGARKIELIGHSVGAHVAGHASRLFKQETGEEIHKIVGLDPASLFFTDNPERALHRSDAKNVLVFHTNTDRYGYKQEIGTKDIFVNGGRTQPICRSKLTYHICSHTYAWQAYSNYLKDKASSTGKRGQSVRSRRYVLCLDVSRSMNDHSRLIRAIGSAKKVISRMKVGSYMGIVTFSDNAEITHNIIQIKGDAERKSLISKLPIDTIRGTNIGAGLNLSMNLLRALPQSDTFCSIIVLISDGDNTVGDGPEIILPKLQEACIGVNSVALGAQASEKLEKISSDGDVSNVMENDITQQIADTDEALSFLFENDIDADIRPIYLPSKQVALSNDENYVSFFIDENIGKDTEFTFYNTGIKNVDVKLISPKGQLYSSTSPEYIYDASQQQKNFKIDLAESGRWKVLVAKSKTRRSIRSTTNEFVKVSVRTHQLDDKVSPIRLDATVSSRTLEYPKSTIPRDVEQARIIISAELRRARFPIIHADVIAHIQSSNSETISLRLQDDGAYPDDLANDGVYKASITQLPNPERYSIFVAAASNGSAKLVPKEIDYFVREVIDYNRIACETINYFERRADIGSIRLISKNNSELIPPNPITDFRATVRNESQRLISLEWTSQVNEVFQMKIKRYDIRALIHGQEFENAFQFNETHFVEGSLDATNSTTGQLERFVLRIPDDIWKFETKYDEPGFFLELIFAVKAIGTNAVASSRSNLALVAIKERIVLSVFEIKPRKMCRILHKRIPEFGWIALTYC